MKLRWVKVSDGVWVDAIAFYCIRRRAAGYHDFVNVAGDAGAYEATEIFPGCLVEALGATDRLPAAKALCQRHYDSLRARRPPELT